MSDSEDKNPPSRVSITYSVDFGEVPERVQILMNELASSFGGIAKLSRESGVEVTTDPLSGTRKIAELKTLIEKMAVRAGDCVDIMVGYIKILQEYAAATAEEEAPKPAAKKKTTKKKTTKKKPTKKKEE